MQREPRSELYTVRNIISQNPAQVLNAIQTVGYKEAEAVYRDPRRHRTGLKRQWPEARQRACRYGSLHGRR